MSDEPADSAAETGGMGDDFEPATESVDEADGDDGDGPRFRRILNYGLLAGLLLLALVAAVGFYTAVSSAITTWVSDEWRPLFRAAFNLAVLLVAGAGIAWQARRMA